MNAAFRAGGRLALAVLVCAAGCSSVAPLAPLAVKWGADLISAAANNYSPQYSQQVESLLLAVYSDQVAKKMPGQQVGQAGQAAYPAPAGQAQPYPAPSSSSSPTQADPYASSGAASNNPYPPQAASPSNDPYSAPSLASSLTTGPQGYGASASPYPPAGNSATASAIVLDVAILAQRASDRAALRTEPQPIQDGEALRDGGSDPRTGDVVKFSFRANCDCYVYVIGVDATGYVARIFPEKSGKPVRANQQYVVPRGTSWYGLDQYKGTEQVFFIASRRPRPDLEKSLQQLSQTPRSTLSRNYRPVREAALPDAATRGLVKVNMGTKSTVSSESGQPYAFTPQAFAAQPGTDDVVVTRWFRHE
jgi:Domain of unknown function (DUF4384)